MVMAQPVGFWAGMALTLLGGVVGGIMRAMGLGQPKESARALPHTAPAAKREPAAAES